MSEVEAIKGKVCTKCSEFKEFEYFYKNAASSDGRYSICRACKSAATRKWPLTPEGTRQCYKCELVKPLDEFRRATEAGRNRAVCKACLYKTNRDRIRDKDKLPGVKEARLAAQRERYIKKADIRAEYFLKRFYNMTLEDYNALLDKQGGVCALCEEPETAVTRSTKVVKRLSVDHDHSCCPGKETCGECVRGLLCSRCNTALSLLDRVEHSKVVAYIEQR